MPDDASGDANAGSPCGADGAKESDAANDAGRGNGANGANDGDADNQHDASGSSSDSLDNMSADDIDAAFASFEQDFADMGDPTIAEMNAALERNENPGDTASANGAEPTSGTANGAEDDDDDFANDLGSLDGSDGSGDSGNPGADDDDDDFESDLNDVADFEDDLMQMLGEKARCAVLVTQLKQPDMLAALCVLAEIDAYAVPSPAGCIAVLKDLAADHPEHSAKAFSKLVPNTVSILLVNRAGHIESHPWERGVQGEQFPPPLVFSNEPSFLEDFMIGQIELPELLGEYKDSIIDTDKVNRAKAFAIIQNMVDRANKAKRRRFGFGFRRHHDDDPGFDESLGEIRRGGTDPSSAFDDGNDADDDNGAPGNGGTGNADGDGTAGGDAPGGTK